MARPGKGERWKNKAEQQERVLHRWAQLLKTTEEFWKQNGIHVLFGEALQSAIDRQQATQKGTSREYLEKSYNQLQTDFATLTKSPLGAEMITQGLTQMLIAVMTVLKEHDPSVDLVSKLNIAHPMPEAGTRVVGPPVEEQTVTEIIEPGLVLQQPSQAALEAAAEDLADFDGDADIDEVVIDNGEQKWVLPIVSQPPALSDNGVDLTGVDVGPEGEPVVIIDPSIDPEEMIDILTEDRHRDE